MSNHLSAKVYQKKKKSDNMIVSVIKISKKMKNKILLGIAKKNYRIGKNTLL